MPEIYSVEDLVRVLRENPEWVETLRGILLTRELLELPERFAQYAERTDARFAEMAAAITRLSESVDARFAEMAAAITRLSESVDARFEQVDARFEQVDARFEQIDARLDRLEVSQQRMEASLGVLLGSHARDRALGESPFMVRRLGFRETRRLTNDDLFELVEAADTTLLPANEVDSFLRADLVVEAQDNGETVYIAVEISYTVDSSDTDRAARNAEWLRMFTGRPAYAVAAGVQRHASANARLDTGEVAWYELPLSSLAAE